MFYSAEISDNAVDNIVSFEFPKSSNVSRVVSEANFEAVMPAEE